MVPTLNTESKKKASSYAKQMYSLLSSIRQNVCNIAYKFKDLNWLPVINRIEQCVISIVFKFINGNCPYYLNELFEFAAEGNISLKNSFLKLKRSFRNTNSPANIY